MKLTLAGLGKYDYIGVLLLRIGVGALVAYHGFPALLGGADAWTDIGSGASIMRIDSSLYLALGLASCVIQVFGGLLLILGLLSRGASLLLVIVAGLALANIIQRGDFALNFFAHLQITLTLLGLVFIGPGRLSFDRRGI